MSSGTSTKRRQGRAPAQDRATAPTAPPSPGPPASDGGSPWTLFVLIGLFGASAVVFVARAQHAAAVLLLAALVFSTAVAAMALYRTLTPLVTGQTPAGPEMLGGRTRAALEREKALVLRSIKELEFDRAMGKVSAADFEEMASRLRARAIRLMQQLDQGSGYRELIEKELARRVPRTTPAGVMADEGKAGALPLVVFVLVLVASAAYAQMPGGAPAGQMPEGHPPVGGGAAGGATGGAGMMGGMPDVGQMAGMPIPVGDLPAGTVTVRVVRQQLGNNLPNHDVELQVGNEMRAAKTDDSGRAQFSGLVVGTRVQAFAQVDGEKLMSEGFQVPAEGGVRVLLASGLPAAGAGGSAPAAAAPGAAPVNGTVAFGPNSQLVFEFQDDQLSVFYLLDIVNAGGAPVDTGGPLLLDMPHGAVGTTVMEGSTSQATARGTRVTIMGPFAPGTTSLQVAFNLPYSGSSLRVMQTWPAPLQATAVAIQKIGNMEATSPQFAQVGIRQLENGPFIVGTGGPVAARQPLTIELSGLPHHPVWPRYVALGLAGLILAAGVWLSRGRSDAPAMQAQLQRRDRLFADLVQLEEQRAAGQCDERAYAEKRAVLVQQLERVYAELDGAGGPVTTGGGEGLAA